MAKVEKILLIVFQKVPPRPNTTARQKAYEVVKTSLGKMVGVKSAIDWLPWQTASGLRTPVQVKEGADRVANHKKNNEDPCHDVDGLMLPLVALNCWIPRQITLLFTSVFYAKNQLQRVGRHHGVARTPGKRSIRARKWSQSPAKWNQSNRSVTIASRKGTEKKPPDYEKKKKNSRKIHEHQERPAKYGRAPAPPKFFPTL